MKNKSLIKQIIDLSYNNREGHLGSALSVLDILYIVYKNHVINFTEEDRNRLILSKGHSSLALYTVLKEFGHLKEDINNFCKFDSGLGGHPSDKTHGVEVSTGSLGHGLPVGVGMALGYRARKFNKHIFVVIGDGEMNEGSIWEAFLLASNHNLNNITCILDYNHSNDRAVKLNDVISKLTAFNWHCIEIDGHDHSQIDKGLEYRHLSKPIFIIANTVKGKGILIMEHNPEWHHKIPNQEEYNNILKNLTSY